MARRSRRVAEDQFRQAQQSLCPPDLRLGPPESSPRVSDVPERVDQRWLNTDQACEYLCFTGKDRLHSLYRWLDANSVRRFYRSPKRLLLLRADLDDALRRPAAGRRRNRVKAA